MSIVKREKSLATINSVAVSFENFDNIYQENKEKDLIEKKKQWNRGLAFGWGIGRCRSRQWQEAGLARSMVGFYSARRGSGCS